ncbi:MAG: hypothetical protein AAFZ15_11075 [Bacteroidota bacterium]
MQTATKAPNVKSKMVTVNLPRPVFESPNLSENDGSYTANLKKVGWTCHYQVQLKNISQQTIKVNNVSVNRIIELEGTQQVNNTFENQGRITPKLPKTITPGSDIQFIVPLKRIAPNNDTGGGINVIFQVEYSIANVDEQINGGWASR